MSLNQLHKSRIDRKSRGSVSEGSRSGIHRNQATKVAVICGGPSVEHEVSLWSAKNILLSCESAGYETEVIYVQKDGRWVYSDKLKDVLKGSSNTKVFNAIAEIREKKNVSFRPGEGICVETTILDVDVVFPIIHGTMGEDGTLQGTLELLGIPYVGCGVLASSIGMDKSITKLVAEHEGIPVVRYIVATEEQFPIFSTVKEKFGSPIFVKPASLGSSVGVSKVNNEEEFAQALKEVFELDRKALIEEAIVGREVECSILTNDGLKISGVGEVSTTHDFYSFEAKYLDENGVKITVPAELSEEIVKKIQEYSSRLAIVCGLRGLTRIDYFYRESDGSILLNEMNTLPGFTAMSMYPRLWACEGYSAVRLINALIDDALDKPFQKI